MDKKMTKRGHPLYSRWKGIMDRCYLKSNSNYKYYGGIGVTVSERWHEFYNFVEDVDNHMENGHLLYSKDFQIDKDKNGGNIYSLRNCVVLSSEENKKMAYEKQQRQITAIYETGEIAFSSITEASRILGISRNTVQYYLKNGKRHSSGYRFHYCF